jgi:putative membrane protein
MYGYDDYGMSGWMWVWGAALVIGVLALIGGLVWAIVATTGHRRAPQAGAGESGPTPARRILDERYARGELDTEEYRERVSALGG